MKNFIGILFLVVLIGCSHAVKKDDSSGEIQGSILPEDVSIRIVAKLAGTNHEIPGNIKGELFLQSGGSFVLRNLPPGKYDLLFKLQDESRNKYIAYRWSEVVVKAGERVTGINYRVTPVGAQSLIDEVIVAFLGIADAKARKIISQAGCTIKDEPLSIEKMTYYVVDIPDTKSIEEMVQHFKGTIGVFDAGPNGITRGG